jgi:hypothetical protein
LGYWVAAHRVAAEQGVLLDANLLVSVSHSLREYRGGEDRGDSQRGNQGLHDNSPQANIERAHLATRLAAVRQNGTPSMIAWADNFVRMKKSSPFFVLQFGNTTRKRCPGVLAINLQTPFPTGAEPFDEFNGFRLEFRVGSDRI